MTKKIHIIGICGTFMGGVARLAKSLGYEVQGSDQNTYPPMSTQLEELGIELFEGYSADNISSNIGELDIVVVGNTIGRGNPELEYLLNSQLKHDIRYTSGAQWLSENVLQQRWVLAIAGTHGKTTSSSLLAWILEYGGYKPGFLIGGVPENFGVSARLGESDFFVIEADEYDTSFADKRSKFVHYQPNTLVINNLEFDHADIFADLAAIQTQFHHLIKTVPSNGQIIFNNHQPCIKDTLDKGCWSEQRSFSFEANATEDIDSDFEVTATKSDGSEFTLNYKEEKYPVAWGLIGEHNLNNAVAAIAAAHHVGMPISQACEALSQFKSVKRRLETKGKVNNITVYDDFAHHPTAITSTIEGLRKNIGEQRLIAVIEPRSNTMKQGTHKNDLIDAVGQADLSYFAINGDVKWDSSFLQAENRFIFDSTDILIEELLSIAKPNDHILMMSNGGFENIHNRLLSRLQETNTI